MDYMDLAVRCSRKAVKLNHSLTHTALHWFKHYRNHSFFSQKTYMGCPLVRIFFRKLAILYYEDTVLYLVDPIECTWFRFCCGLVAVDLPISFKVTSLALGQPYGCPNTSEVTLRNKGKCLTSLEIMNKHNKTKHINNSIRIFHGT